MHNINVKVMYVSVSDKLSDSQFPSLHHVDTSAKDSAVQSSITPMIACGVMTLERAIRL